MANNSTNTLAQQGWFNGSLYPQLYTYQASYVNSNTSSDIDLLLYTNDSASLTFPLHNDPNLAFTLYLAQSIFSPNNFRVPVVCVYPLSGQYDVLTRGLFYLLLVFSLVFRRHTWVSTAALGSALVYAASTAVHAFALFTRFGFGTPSEPSSFLDKEWLPNGWNANTSQQFGDIDVYGIYPILSAGAIMLTPILNWSITIRKHNAQAAVIYWGILVFAALVPAWLRYNNIGREWWLNAPISFVLCPNTNDPTDALCHDNMTLTTHLYNHCQCTDFCGTISPTTSMRKDANMVPFIGRPISITASNSQPLANLGRFNEFILAFIVVQGIFGLIESQFTQSEVRNYVFRALYAEPRDFIMLLFDGKRKDKFLKRFGMERPSPKTSLRWKVQFQMARFVAASFFTSAIIFAVVCPFVFITNIITTEFHLTSFPVSELSDAVGAWSTWSSAAFVLIGATISEYHKSWMKSLQVAIRSTWRVVQYARGEPERESQYQADKPERVRDRIKAFFREISIPFVHAWYSTLRAYWTLRYTEHTFVEWLRDPIRVSKQSRKEMEELADDYRKTRSPKCMCQQCQRDRAKGVDEKKLMGERKDSSFGEHIAKGIEKRYTMKRKEQGDPGDFGLPLVPHTSALSLPLVNIDVPTPSVQPRQTFARQNTDSSPRPFSVPRKPVTGSAERDSSPESAHPEPTPGIEREQEALLQSHPGADPTPQLDRHFTTEPVGEVDEFEPRSLKRSSRSGYDRLPS